LCLGMIRVFHWSGRDLSERRMEHELVLSNQLGTPEEQLREYFFVSDDIGAVWGSNIFGP